MSNQPRAHAVCGCEGPSSGLFSAYVQARWKNEALPPRARDDGSAALNLNTPRFASAALVSAEASRQRRDASAEATRLTRRRILRARDEILRRRASSSSYVARVSPSSPFAVSDASDASGPSASRDAARMRAAPSAMARSNLCAASSSRPWCEYIRPRRFRISPGSASKRANDARSSSGSSVPKRTRAASGTADAAAAASSAACSSASACVRPFTRRRDAAMAAR